MATLCRAYSSEDDAHAAVDRLLAAGIAGSEVQVLAGAPVHDARDEAIGGYAGTANGDAVIGAYAGAGHSAREAMGTFAGDGDGRRRGGFSDADRDTVTTHAAGITRTRIGSHHDLEKMLVAAGLDAATAKADVRALHEGRVLVLVQSPMGLDDIAAVIDG